FQESAWKVGAEFFRTPEAQFLPHEIATLEPTPLPEAGIARQLAISTNVGTKRLELHFIAGPGEYAYSNNVLISARPNPPGVHGSSKSFSGLGLHRERRITAPRPHVFLSVGDLAPGEMLAFRAVDDQERRSSSIMRHDAAGSKCMELPLSS